MQGQSNIFFSPMPSQALKCGNINLKLLLFFAKAYIGEGMDDMGSSNQQSV